MAQDFNDTAKKASSCLSFFLSEQMWATEPHVVSENGLTWGGRLDLSSLVLFVVCKDLRRRVFTTLNFALKGVETLDVLLFQRTGSTAGCTHV